MSARPPNAPPGVLADELRARLDVVERQHQHLLLRTRSQPGGCGHGARAVRRAQLRSQRRQVADQRGVVDAVVGALELGHHRPAGEGAGCPHGSQDRLGAGAAEAQPLQGRHPLGEQLGQLHLQRRGREVGGAAPGSLADGGDHRRMGVAEDQGAGVVDEVQTAVAVDVDQVHALGVVDVERERIDEHPGPGVAARQHRLRTAKQLVRTGVAVAVIREQGVQGDDGRCRH